MTALLDRPSPARRPRPPRPQPPRHSRKRLLIASAVAAVLAIVITWVVAFSSVLGVRSVEVRGMQVLTPDDVRAAADVEHGEPLVRVDTAAIRKRVLSLPEVASVGVQVSYPSTVVITVVERRAVGYTVTDGVTHLVDRTGSAYRTVDVKPLTLPKLVIGAGDAARSTSAAVAKVAAGLPQNVLQKVTSIQGLDPDAITMVLRSGKVIRWGSASHTGDKARILPVLILQPGRTFDLTDWTQPVVR